MIYGDRYTAGLGDSALFLRLSRLGQFWDWIAGEAITGETSDTALYVVEYPNSGDSAQSWYGADITVPAGGPWTVELVEASTGVTIASDVAGVIPPVDYPITVTLDTHKRPIAMVMASDPTQQLMYHYTGANSVPDAVEKAAV
jgi:hypothetical protein